MRHTIILLFLIILFGCSDLEENGTSIFFPINQNELSFKKGDYLTFPIDTANYGLVIICEYHKEESGIWYAVLFTNYHSDTVSQNPSLTNVQLLGRNVTSTLNEKGYEIMLDGEFISDSLIKATNFFKYVGNLSLNEEKVELGSYGFASDFKAFITSLNYAVKQRGPDKQVDKVTSLLLPKNSEGYYLLTDFIK